MGGLPIALFCFGGVPFAGNVFKRVSNALLRCPCLLLVVGLGVDALR